MKHKLCEPSRRHLDDVMRLQTQLNEHTTPNTHRHRNTHSLSLHKVDCLLRVWITKQEVQFKPELSVARQTCAFDRKLTMRRFGCVFVVCVCVCVYFTLKHYTIQWGCVYREWDAAQFG